MSRPTVLLLDTKDDRLQVRDALRHLLPTERVDFLDWSLDFAREVLVGHPNLCVLARAVADRPKMAPMVVAAELGDRDADARLTREVYGDLCVLAHQWGVEFLPLLLELENWAKRRTVTPAVVAAAAWRAGLSSPSRSRGTLARSRGSTG